ncbi:hypothetical protein SacxiDRAFT_3593 [Saccharomonospora xinjiangensis XJ-54]|uniref:Uncharacterized protein n=1 Tax=Saccharomonospora xinjiangensis XJ-54 TaxID=882086 RepID=I0V6N6_9PSEU|nr:hypothetical protein SacxiDRAFT_3593 [Saccharomonospora xinjiangensis XJ-54]
MENGSVLKLSPATGAPASRAAARPVRVALPESYVCGGVTVIRSAPWGSTSGSDEPGDGGTRAWTALTPAVQLVMSFVANRRAASRPNTAAYTTAERTPLAMLVQSTSVAMRSIHANEKWVGRKSRRSPRAVI